MKNAVEMTNAGKYLFAAAIAAMFAGGMAAECTDGVCMLPPTPGEAEFSVVSPVPEAAIEPMREAPRLKSLDGKTIALVGGSFMANVTHPPASRTSASRNTPARSRATRAKSFWRTLARSSGRRSRRG